MENNKLLNNEEQKQPISKKQKRITAILMGVVAVLLLLLIIFVFIVSPATIYGESMSPTLIDGQMIMISRINRNPQINDIVIYKKPTENKKVIKRVVGVAGDTFVLYQDVNNHKTLRKENSDMIFPLSANQYYFLSSQYSKNKFTIKIGEVFTIGDNYENSVDGRDYGAIQIESIIGIKINWQQKKLRKSLLKRFFLRFYPIFIVLQYNIWIAILKNF